MPQNENMKEEGTLMKDYYIYGQKFMSAVKYHPSVGVKLSNYLRWKSHLGIIDI